MFNRTWSEECPYPLESLNSLEFYGQRPWRQGQQGMYILDHNKERDGILCLQELETKENLTVNYILNNTFFEKLERMRHKYLPRIQSLLTFD